MAKKLTNRSSGYVLGCKHEWRIVEGFFKDHSRNKRSYPAYCIFCMEVAEVILEVDKIK